MARRAACDKATATADAAVKSKSRLTFLNLPLETQQEIASHCSQGDLICLALVSKHFHELASAQLYRNFHIIFPDDDDVQFDSPIDGLAGGLDTFTTSNYNYAKHLKDLSMDTLSAGAKGESAYHSYLYSASCGKFLNTLLHLTLKKATSLEAFRWNIRVELSRPVYRELHRIASLKKLHIRMQDGQSYYTPPPPLPVSADAHVTPAPTGHWLNSSSLAPALTMASPPAPGEALSTIPGSPSTFAPPPKFLPKTGVERRGTGTKTPPTLSGFRNLTSLSVLDIDNLDIVAELKACIRNSSLTLDELQLSLSDALAIQARRPSPDSDPDDSDIDDEFQAVPVSHNTNYDTTGPAKAFRAQEERKMQDAVLGRIFDVRPVATKDGQEQAHSDDSDSDQGSDEQEKSQPESNPREEFFAAFKYIAVKLLSNGARDHPPSQQEMMDTIMKAARKYVDSSDVPVQGGQSSDSSNGSGTITGTDDADKSPSNSPSVEDAEAGLSEDRKEAEDCSRLQTNTNNDGERAEGSSARKQSRGKDDASPEDIDIVHLDVDVVEDVSDDEQLLDIKGKGAQDCTTETGAAGPSNPDVSQSPTATSSTKSGDVNSHTAHRVDFETLMGKLKHFQDQADALSQRIQDMRTKRSAVDAAQIRDAEAELQRFSNSLRDVQSQIQAIGEEIGEAERQLAAGSSDNKAAQQGMRRYIRDTRGLSLTSLSIYLVPVKASVLSRAINLACLRQLTLLNVGNQAPVWTLLAKENKVQPLALRSIFTDNICNAFLTCASQLEELHELFLLERNAKYKPESFAPRTTITMDQIRRQVLRNHIGTLKRLMINDETGEPKWDANEKTMILICTRGRQLEELAVSLNIHAMHAFMQYFSGLVNLRAINIIHFRNNDTCISVMREVLKFIVDNLSHHPELKLEWIAMENERVEQIVRSSGPDEANRSQGRGRGRGRGKGKGKGNSPPVGMNSGIQDDSPALAVDSLDPESESEDDSVDTGKRLRFKTVGPMPFFEVWGVRIFEKEIRSGKL